MVKGDFRRMGLVGRNNTKILSFFLKNKDKSFTRRELSKELNMNKNSVYWALVDLLIQKMVKEESSCKPFKYSLHDDLKN